MTDLDKVIATIERNRRAEWINAYADEYGRVLDSIRDEYFMADMTVQHELKELDDTFHAWTRGDSDEFPSKFVEWVKGVTPDAFAGLSDSPDEMDSTFVRGHMALLLIAFNKVGKGRNTSCWPLYDDGGKDADLDPGGCCGIKNIIDFKDGEIHLEIGGHKTLCDPTYEFEFDLSEDDESSYSMVANEIVGGAGFGGEWTGDDWTLATSDVIKVPAVYDGSGRFDATETVEAAIEAFEKAIEGYQNEMADVSKALDELYNELYEKYEKLSQENND